MKQLGYTVVTSAALAAILLTIGASWLETALTVGLVELIAQFRCIEVDRRYADAMDLAFYGYREDEES